MNENQKNEKAAAAANGGKGPPDDGPAGDKKILVIVKYVGHDDFTDAYPGGIAFEAIKKQAMHFFGIEASAAPKYALQYNGADVPAGGHLRDLGVPSVTLKLVLIDEVVKG